MTDMAPRKAVTMADVARASEVSIATVSRVLNGNPKVAPELVRRVESAVERVNYRPNGAGRALRRQKSDLWAVIVPDIRNPFFIEVIDAFERVADAEGYSVVLCNSQEDLSREKTAIDTVIAHQVSGVLIAAASPQTDLGAFESYGIPVVTIDRRVAGFSGDAVTIDNILIGHMAAEHLLEQGCTRPVILSHTVSLSPMRDRERGFRQRMAEAGHPVNDDWVAHLAFHEGRQCAIADLLRSCDGVDAVFATTNTLTSEAFGAMQDLGMDIGPEVALVGVDDHRWNTMVQPQVTVVDQPGSQLGTWAGELLAARARGQKMTHGRITLDPVLLARASSERSAQHELQALPAVR